MDVRKSFTDAGYIAIGLGVMGFQQAQVRGRQLQERVQIDRRLRRRPGPRRSRTGSPAGAGTSTPGRVRRVTAPRARSPRPCRGCRASRPS